MFNIYHLMVAKLQALRTHLSTPPSEIFIRFLMPACTRYPVLGTVLGSLAALTGYAFLSFFPLALILLIWKVPVLILDINSLQDGIILATTILSIIITSLMSYALFSSKFSPPRGLILEQDMAPKLFQHIEDIENQYAHAVVHRIILRNDFSLNIIKTPRFGMPFITHNTMIIGMPLLLTLSNEIFTTLLTRRIGQAIGKHHKISSHLLHLRTTWRRYRDGFAHRGFFTYRIYYFFFRIFIPFYDLMSFFAARNDELASDHATLHIMNDRDFAAAISQEIVARKFLDKIYWPKIYQLAREDKTEVCYPYRHMGKVIRKGLRREDIHRWIKEAMKRPPSITHYMPSLPQRLESIGHTKPGAPEPVTSNAGLHFIAPNALAKIISRFDAQWLKLYKKRLRKDSKKAA